jgi:threonyl-tRNA synthetase
VLTDAEKPTIEKAIEAVCKEGQRFERIVVSRDEALSMFQENKFKVGGAATASLPAAWS